MRNTIQLIENQLAHIDDEDIKSNIRAYLLYLSNRLDEVETYNHKIICIANNISDCYYLHNLYLELDEHSNEISKLVN